MRFTHLALFCGSLLISFVGSAHAHDRFSFSLDLGYRSPGAVYVGPYPGPYYVPVPPPPPPPIVYRRVYVESPPVYVVPAPRTVPVPPPPPPLVIVRQPRDLVLLKIGELHSRSADVREEATQWLGEARDQRAVRPLIEVLKHDPDHDVREDAARALGQIGSVEAEHALQVAAESDPASDVRRAASKALDRVAKEVSRRNLQ